MTHARTNLQQGDPHLPGGDSDARLAICSRLSPFGETIFATISARAHEVGAVNLGQGFPDEDPPLELIQATVDSLHAGHNQYAPMPGILEVRFAIAADQYRRTDVPWDPEREITVTSGATGGLAAALLGTLEPQDEVVLFDPAYDAYPALVALAGATSRRLAPAPPYFEITAELLNGAINDRTRMIVVNTPWNPTGRVLTEAELEVIADVCRKNNLICVSDEVYERLTFDKPHRSIASLPGMRERTIVISSMGKTYSCTGWKIGWTCAPEPLTQAVRAAHQFLVFSIPEPLQRAAQHALEHYGEAWDRRLIADYRGRRDLLMKGLSDAGLNPIQPEGTYFILADFTDLGDEDDFAFCDRLLNTAGVAAIPPSVFTQGGEGCRSLARFAFCKPESVLRDAITRLQSLERLC